MKSASEAGVVQAQRRETSVVCCIKGCQVCKAVVPRALWLLIFQELT